MEAQRREEQPALSAAPLQPLDEHNRALGQAVHPPGWVNPTARGRYNLVVIGAGTAGLVAAAGAAGLGAKVALIERELMGGDCLNVGCVPSKALLGCARAAADARQAGRFAVKAGGDVRVDFPAVMQRMRLLRARLSANDSAERFKALGVDVYFGDARFTGHDTVEVGGQSLLFARAVIATGARAAVPAIPGLRDAGFLTNETVFSLTALPARLAVIGGGPIGCELAQAFARFGSRVTLIQSAARLLEKEDEAVSALVERVLRREGVEVCCGAKLRGAKPQAAGKVVVVEWQGRQRDVEVDALLVAVGRAPNVAGLGLTAAGVNFDERAGIAVDDFLRTSNRRVYAAGDVCTPFKFTHVADAMARIVIQNALFFGHARASALVVPRCTYTDPEVAHVGMTVRESQEAGVEIDTFSVDLGDVDRAVLDGEGDGLLNIHVKRGTDTIVGGALVARHAGEMISELTLAMTTKAGLSALSRTIHPYPTQAEAFRKAGDAYQRTRLTPRIKGVLAALLRWRR